MNMNLTACAAACVMTLALTGCGGGDGGGDSGSQTSSNSQTDGSANQTPGTGTGSSNTTVATPFLGVWKHYPDRYCTDNWPVVPASMFSDKGVMPVSFEFSDTTYSYTHNIYSDVNCTQLEGTVTLTGSLTWAATTVSGWTNPVRVETKYMNYKVTGNVVVDEAEAKDEFSASKTILGISNKQLFAGDLSTVAADGYPTAFRAKPLAYR